MMQTAEVLVVGGGIAGLSVAARLAGQALVTVLEGESAPGYHASGRSVAFAHYGLGNVPVRTLTALSMGELAAHGCIHPALHIAHEGDIPALDALEDVHRHYGCDYSRVGPQEARALVPALKPEACAAAAAATTTASTAETLGKVTTAATRKRTIGRFAPIVAAMAPPARSDAIILRREVVPSGRSTW